MKLSLFDDYRLGVWGAGDTIVDVTHLIDASVRPRDRMNALIEEWDALFPSLARAAENNSALSIRSPVFRAPQPRPTKIVAAAGNHAVHLQEMQAGGATEAPVTIETYVGFLKAPSSIIGPDGVIELPYSDRRIDFEGELGVVIGRRARGVSRADALAYVFGYVPLLDITLRGPEDRPYRKSFDTFTPIGPAIVTADEIPNPCVLDLVLTVNGEVRQRGNTGHFIYDIPRLIEVYSEAMTLEPGDIIASGTPDGVGRLLPGDVVNLAITGIPALTMQVRARERDLSPT
jgi:2-keto-4-pentenoate hydratase/2-oxohepta-3-ene-1,7-dioic acid hydratase in catechol pathway